MGRKAKGFGVLRLPRVKGMRRRVMAGRFAPELEAAIAAMQAATGCSRSYAIAECVARAHGIKRF